MKGNVRLKKALRELEENAKKLEKGQKRIARRNARRLFLASMRKVRRVLDESYPNIPRTGKHRKKKKQNWEPPSNWIKLPKHPVQDYHKWLKVIAQSKVPCRNGWVPNWVIAIGPRPAKLRSARVNKIERSIALVAKLLEGSGF